MTSPIKSSFSTIPFLTLGGDFLESMTAVKKLCCKDASTLSQRDSIRDSSMIDSPTLFDEKAFISSVKKNIHYGIFGAENHAWDPPSSTECTNSGTFFSRQLETIRDSTKPLYSKIIPGISLVLGAVVTVYPVTSLILSVGFLAKEYFGNDSNIGKGVHFLCSVPFAISALLITVGKMFVPSSQKEVEGAKIQFFQNLAKKTVESNLGAEDNQEGGVSWKFHGDENQKQQIINDIDTIKDKCLSELGDKVKNQKWYQELEIIINKMNLT